MASTKSARIEQVEQELESIKNSIPEQVRNGNRELEESVNDMFNMFSRNQDKMNKNLNKIQGELLLAVENWVWK